MAAPALGTVQLRQVRRRCFEASFLFIALALALLPVLIPDGVDGFRIRDIGAASTEHTRPSCNPLFGKCNVGQKIPGISSATFRLRRKFEVTNTPLSRTNKVQPLVEESSEDVEEDEGRFSSGPVNVRTKPDKLPSLRTSTVAKNTDGYSGPAGNAKLKSSFAGSDEDDENEDEDNDDDDEENSEDEIDEENVSDSDHDKVDDEASDGTDEEEENEETSNLDDSDDDDDENDDNEQDDEPDDDSEDEADSVIDRLARIKYGVKDVKPDVASERRNLKDPITRSADKGATKKSVETVEQVREPEIAEERREGVGADDKSAHDDHGMSEQSDTDQPEKAEEEIVDTKTVLSSEISRSDEAPNDDDVNDGSDDEEDDIGSKLVEEATKPPRKLEKVRHADKSKSMESLRAISLEELAAKVEPLMVKKDTSEAKKEEVEVPEPSPQPAPKPEVKRPSKPVEKVSKVSVSQEVKKSEPKPKPKPKPKEEVKSQPKQPEKLKVKTPEPKADKKSEKPKTKSKKGTEASITLPELNDLLLQVPSFIPNFTAIGDPVCQQHGKIFLRQLRGYKLWALQMLDSSAKIPSGLLRGNLNQLGDFDQCLAVKAHVKVDEKTVKVQGKYCLATIDLQATRNDMKIPVNLMQSRAFLRASMNEPTHFVPRFTTANWALCVPAACSPEDVQSVIEDALSAYNVSTGLRFAVGVDPDSCYVKQKPQPYSKETVAVLYFYAMTVCLVLVATLRDYCVTSQGQGSYSERIIMAFSLRRTTTALMQNSDNGGDIRCIHGIRTIATVLLYMAHKLIPIARIPFANRISLTEVANNPLSSILRVSLVYTDSFLLLSGILTAYNMAKDFNQRGEIRWFCRFVTRFIRLTPALLAVVFWYAFVMEHIGSGPQWNSVVKSNAELCKKNAWTNLLYIQNFFPFEEMCATHTHQLALDMQLSLIAPALVFFLYNKPVIGILVTLFLLQVSATVRYLATTNNYLSVVIFHGMTLKHLYKTANLTYALPLHRATPYLFGVALGVLMRYTGKQFRMHKVIVITGWIVATALGLWSLLSPWRLARRDYTYDVEEATYYAVILPVCWAASLSWIIFASFTDHGGVVNRFLSNYWLVVFSRLSYSVYLTQFAVFFYNVGTTRYSSDFQLHRSVDFYEVATVLGVSVTLTLLLDLPMQEVKNVIMECTDGLTIQTVSNEVKNDEVETEDEKRARGQPSEEGKVPNDVELESSGWDWYNDQVSSRKIESGYRDDEESPEVWAYRKDEIPTWDWIQTPVQKGPRRRTDGAEDLRTERRSQSRQETYGNEYVDDSKIQKKARDEDGFRRDVRSQSRASESKRLSAKDPDGLSWDYRKRDDSTSRASNGKRSSSKDFDIAPREFTRRERSLAKDNDAASTRRHEEQPAWEYVKRERSASQSGKEGKKAAFEGLDVQSPALRLSTRSLPRASELQRRLSSEREAEATIPRTSPLDEPRVSDEENWEYELRLRRQKLAADQPSEETTGTVSEEEEWNILKRRSSAEGKMALLSDPPKIDNFGAWSITKEPNSDSTSFPHEQTESEDENSYNPSRSDYRENRPPLREGYDTQSEEETSWDPSRQQSYTSSQPTSLDEEEGPLNYGFVLKRESKRTSLQNLSRISQEEPEAEDDSGWDFVKEETTDSGNPQSSSTGFFKRASIVRSQASEEDPEYLLPERPKLVEQEQEHPFKKAWQMQKSRSEEEGPAGFLVKEKDGKPRSSGAEGRRDNSQTEEVKRKSSTGGQTEDLSYFGGDEAESTSVSYPASNSGDSGNLDWIEDDEPSGASGHDETELESMGSEKRDVPQYGSEEREQGRHSKESNWEWNQEET